MTILYLLLLTLLLLPTVSGLQEWFIKHGGYVHPSLEYKNEGMYATSTISKGAILVKVPISLELKCPKCIDDETALVEMSNVLESERNGFWAPYIQSLPTDCQNPLCKQPDMSILTVMGKRIVKRQIQHPLDNLTTAVMTRKWVSRSKKVYSTTMRPLMDRFNHHASAEEPVLENQEWVLRSAKTIHKGEQAYNNYGKRSLFEWYNSYGYMPADQQPTCLDMQLMRIGNDVQRAACIAYGNSTISLMVEEMQVAMEHSDYVMLKGAAQWLDRYIKFDMVY
jgi:hypothetical protein